MCNSTVMESSEGTALKVKHEPTEPSSAVARIRKLERRNKSLIVGIFGGVGVVVVAVVLLAVFLKANDCEETKKQPEADEGTILASIALRWLPTVFSQNYADICIKMTPKPLSWVVLG